MNWKNKTKINQIVFPHEATNIFRISDNNTQKLQEILTKISQEKRKKAILEEVLKKIPFKMLLETKIAYDAAIRENQPYQVTIKKGSKVQKLGSSKEGIVEQCIAEGIYEVRFDKDKIIAWRQELITI